MPSHPAPFHDQPAPPQARGRLKELDALRGIAVAAVVVYHFGEPFSQFFPRYPKNYDFHQGAFGVELFFLISGFVILMTAWRSKLTSDYVIARATRLYPAYWVGLTLTLLAIFATKPPSLAVTPAQAALNYTMLQRFLLVPDVDRVYWTLAIELVFYFYVFVLLVVTRHRLTPAVVRMFVIAWMTVATAVAAISRGPGSTVAEKILTSVTAAQFAPLFSVGVLAYMSREHKRFEPLIVPGVVLIVTNAWLMVGLEAALISGGLALLFLFVVLRDSVRPLRWRPLVWVGEISYPLYLVHMNIGWILTDRFAHVMPRLPATLVALGCVILLAWAMHRTVEGPVSKQLRRWLTTRRDALRRAETA